MSNGTESAPTMPMPPTPPPPRVPKAWLFGIEPGLARKILAAGVALYLLVTFVENGAAAIFLLGTLATTLLR